MRHGYHDSLLTQNLRRFDDYSVVQGLGDGAYTVGEPRYYRANYSDLIVGKKRVWLFDAGFDARGMRAVVASFTHLPVTVLPSHLHYDHLGGIAAFDHVALVDLDETRADVADKRFIRADFSIWT